MCGAESRRRGGATSCRSCRASHGLPLPIALACRRQAPPATQLARLCGAYVCPSRPPRTITQSLPALLPGVLTALFGTPAAVEAHCPALGRISGDGQVNMARYTLLSAFWSYPSRLDLDFTARLFAAGIWKGALCCGDEGILIFSSAERFVYKVIWVAPRHRVCLPSTPIFLDYNSA
jgi:hypothetical protein